MNWVSDQNRDYWSTLVNVIELDIWLLYIIFNIIINNKLQFWLWLITSKVYKTYEFSKFIEVFCDKLVWR